MEYVNVPGTTRPLAPQAVVLLDPVTGLPYAAGGGAASESLTDAQLRAAAIPVTGPATDAQLRTSPLPVSGPLTDAQLRATIVPVANSPAIDSTGAAFNPDACSHAYGYAAGLLVTDTATNGAASWVKTYSYTAGTLTGETKWVKQ